MVRDIVKDPLFLSRRSEPAGREDLPVCADLRHTLAAHKDGCVGMAANMIGVLKRIIIIDNPGQDLVMLNPEILRRSNPYEAEEGCLCHAGTRRVKRWRSIKVRYQNEKLETRNMTFTGFSAQIIQHEIDHCDGVLI